ncbi:MAG: N-acetylmuramoyl-L-alanine amidase [Clostridia bacterium]|nr:N-acetylmuramoyl-L-alanine amidase [Clostridia bacterium]
MATIRLRPRRRVWRRWLGLGAFFAAAALVAVCLWRMSPARQAYDRVRALEQAVPPDYVTEALIPELGTARSGLRLSDFTGVVIHYVGNPGTSAQGNRNYFATPGTPVVSHFVIGLDGEILQCLPLWERSVASNERNRDTVSIEVCHPDDSGQFTEESYRSLVRLTAWLCHVGDLSSEQVIRHYDVTGKECPRYYVDNEAAWRQLRRDVQQAKESFE